MRPARGTMDNRFKGETMEYRQIVRGQRVPTDKLSRARELRKSMTPEESLLWSKLRRNGLEGIHVRRQQVIDGFIVDFYCNQAGVVIEIDGPVHDQMVEDDRQRDAALHDRGLRVIHVTNQEIRSNLELVLQRIARSCGEIPGPPEVEVSPLPVKGRGRGRGLGRPA